MSAFSFDIVSDYDKAEMNNVYDDPKLAGVVKKLTAELDRLQRQVQDTPS